MSVIRNGSYADSISEPWTGNLKVATDAMDQGTPRQVHGPQQTVTTRQNEHQSRRIGQAIPCPNPGRQHSHNSNLLSQATYRPDPGQALLQLIINGFVVTQSQTRWIRHQISGYDIIIYLQEQNNWDSETCDIFDWCGFEKAIKSRLQVMHCPISEFVNGWWNTGNNTKLSTS